jgi:putative hemolysin
MRQLNAPSLFAGFLPPAPWDGVAAKLFQLDRFEQTFALLRVQDDERPMPQRLLDFLEVTYTASPRDLEQIPRKGPCVVVANHPFGFLESALLVTVLRQIRPDVRVLANEVAQRVPELREVVIPVDVLHGNVRANIAAMRSAVDFLTGGGLLLVFPAGTVSHFQWRERASVDPAWSPTVARLIGLAARRGAKAQVVPVYVPGKNSFLFHAAGMAHPVLRTALLAHEFFNKKKTVVELHVGRAVSAEKLLAMGSDEERIQYLRWRTYLLAGRQAYKARTKHPLLPRKPARVAEEHLTAVPVAALVEEIAQLPAEALLDRSGDLEVYCSPAPAMPNVLREIGRLREVTFRAVGEGTGRALDLDRFDWYYQHLFVWNARKQELVGAYRLQGSDETSDLYTRTLFQYDERFLKRMGPALELGRSFVRAEYQRGFAPLLLLWKGIGKLVARHPRYKTLFGPVSISNQYQAVSRELMLAFLEKRASLDEWTGLVRARHAPTRERRTMVCNDLDELSEVVSDVDPAQAGVPVLLRQYLRLGGRLLGFSVDPAFSDALDGLIVVDLTRTEPKLRERYLGKDEAAVFLAFHNTFNSNRADHDAA